ncbi:DgyrCDS625 [Dimorphilus gyrociliatus]|uniref:cystathionine gamma-lyase n=1 Tax=Dimorphilus gyrociliatus TaxID=2664684 RepID=A0A7I8V500_9ANNE|nr:DgyrCDS625 [Dimorphilus gyrociliatus]
MSENFQPFPHFSTDALHAGQDPEQWNCKAVVPLISLSTTFKQEAPGKHSGYEYTRAGNPTRTCLEACFAAIEGGKHACVFSSGLAATGTVTSLLDLDDHIIAMDDLYGGTNRFFRNIGKARGIKTSFADMRNPEHVKKALTPKTKLVWIETPTNPTMRLVDIKAVAEIAHAYNADIMVAVDNTFTTSYFQRPLSLGADIVFHSVTKYLNGHSDVLMGALMLNSTTLYEKLQWHQLAAGAVPSPFDCYLVNRGLKTLAVRLKQHQHNALTLAKHLEGHPKIEKVIHPGLPSHPQHDLAVKQQRGFSGMLTIYVKGGLKEASTFLSSLKVFTLAESLGGYESLAELPSLMTHASVSAEERAKLDISDSLIRLSVGLEDIEDLIADVNQALDKAIPSD